VAGLFPPQEERWGLDAQVGLTPQAAERVGREAASQPFDVAARSLNADWGTQYDGKQVQRWGEHYGRKIAAAQEQERRALSRGVWPSGPENGPELLAVGMDGGRVQEREKDADTLSRWHEDKVVTVSSYRIEPAKEAGGDPRAVRQVTTYVGTMQGSERFGQLARVEAERRGIRQACEVVVIGDGASWIDSVAGAYFGCHERIIDYYHVAERLEECARAVEPVDESRRKRLAERLRGRLYEGKVKRVIRWIEKKARWLGAVREKDPEGHPRRVLWGNLGYVQRHQGQMEYPRYRAKGWPIGSGVTESGVKLFNKRVKGTEQFWNESGAESIVALRGLLLSQDERWNHYWLCGHLRRQAA
jgi:hypothetical protein